LKQVSRETMQVVTKKFSIIFDFLKWNQVHWFPFFILGWIKHSKRESIHFIFSL
jgi:hypothetical protein